MMTKESITKQISNMENILFEACRIQEMVKFLCNSCQLRPTEISKSHVAILQDSTQLLINITNKHTHIHMIFYA